MAIEAKVSGTPQEVKRDYPYLGRAEDGTIVFFTEPLQGVRINGRSQVFFRGWYEHNFTPLSPSETITLSNK